MFITVLICTRNRADSLHDTLASIFCPSNLAQHDWEVVVIFSPVDQNKTLDVCREYQQSYPKLFTAYAEDSVGKSCALNVGIARSRGDILAMTDDDVRCGSDYIHAIRATFNDTTIDAAQGRVLLDCEGGRPSWMDEEMAAFMSLRDFGEEPQEWQSNLTGTNMIVRRQVIKTIGGFCPAMGASAVGFMEDSEFSMRLYKAGFRVIYAPTISVAHRLDRCRLSAAFFLERYFRWGRSQAYMQPLPVKLVRFSMYAVRQFISSETSAVWHHLVRHQN